MSQKNFSVSLELDNIGPHYGDKRINFSDIVDSNKAIFFATNGTGKSFISRVFQLCSPLNNSDVADDLLTINSNKGHMHLCIKDENSSKDVMVTIQRGQRPIVQGDTEYLFHVFNNDYVENNIKLKNYSHDGHIEGYILGKAQIDLAEEREMERKLCLEVTNISSKIDERIDGAKSELIANGVAHNTVELNQITRENIERGFDYGDNDSFENIMGQLHTLSTVPEHLEDIAFTTHSFQLDFLDEVNEILGTKYPKSEWDEEFVKEYKSHQSFIENGLDMDHVNEVCPFCKRAYDYDARKLITHYKEYRSDCEAQITSQLVGIIKKIDTIIAIIDQAYTQNQITITRFLELKKYFPSLRDSYIRELSSSDRYIQDWKNMKELVESKINNLCIIPASVEKVISRCRYACDEIIKLQRYNKETIINVNKIKGNTKSERLLLRRNLCKARALLLHADSKQLFEALKITKCELDNVRKDIKEKEQQTKTSKRDKVHETLKKMLDIFFAGKYQIDKDTFHIIFNGNKLENNASKILSDGEKSIVAFCWYIAETHIIINDETDYNKLFFIIDDPISSMDFHFVYAVSHVLKNVKSIFEISTHDRMWLFTHSLEFFNIVVRNHVMTRAYLFSAGAIHPFNKQLLMPYANHLFDLLKVAEGICKGNHTTGNSIRHVIETISKFEDPEIKLEKYVQNSPELQTNPCLFSLCQDMSHGAIRDEMPYSEDTLREASRTVIAFVEERYPRQIEIIRKLSGKC